MKKKKPTPPGAQPPKLEGFKHPPTGDCRCHRRWPKAFTLVVEGMNVRPVDPDEVGHRDAVVFVPWFPTEGKWPFDETRSHTMIYGFPYTIAEEDMTLTLTARIGLARCECGNIIVYGENIHTSWGLSFSAVAAVLPHGSGGKMKKIMWERTLDVMPSLREEALKLSWPFLPEAHA